MMGLRTAKPERTGGRVRMTRRRGQQRSNPGGSE